MIDKEKYSELSALLKSKGVTLVAVSKMKPIGEIKQLYDLGQRDFGENYVQELVEKESLLPKDIRWHFIGHLQTNKVKHIAPFIHLIQSVDSEKLLSEINKQAGKNKRNINCLLQVHIANEETKFGFDESELKALSVKPYSQLAIRGMMGMASFTKDKSQVRKEFAMLRNLLNARSKETSNNEGLNILSMGMSDDYEVAVECGSNMVRIGSLLFGNRQFSQGAP